MKTPLSIFIPILSCLILLISGSIKESIADQAWQFRPSLSVSETYNSNIFSSTDEAGDFITGIGANINTAYKGTNTGLWAKYTATWNSFSNYPELNVVTHDGTINIEMARWFNKFLRNVSINVSEDFTYTPDLGDYYFDAEREGSATLSNYGIRTERNNSFRNSVSINMGFPLSQNQDLYVRYSNLLTEFSDSGPIDNIANSLSIGTSYTARHNTLYGHMGIKNTTAD